MFSSKKTALICCKDYVGYHKQDLGRRRGALECVNADEAFPLLFPQKNVDRGQHKPHEPHSPQARLSNESLLPLHTAERLEQESHSRVDVGIIGEQTLIIVNGIGALQAQLRSTQASIQRFGAPPAKLLFSFGLRCQLLPEDFATLPLLVTGNELGQFAASCIVVVVKDAVEGLDSGVGSGRRRCHGVDGALAIRHRSA